jgi:hypothetical protein
MHVGLPPNSAPHFIAPWGRIVILAIEELARKAGDAVLFVYRVAFCWTLSRSVEE